MPPNTRSQGLVVWGPVPPPPPPPVFPVPPRPGLMPWRNLANKMWLRLNYNARVPLMDQLFSNMAGNNAAGQPNRLEIRCRPGWNGRQHLARQGHRPFWPFRFANMQGVPNFGALNIMMSHPLLYWECMETLVRNHRLYFPTNQGCLGFLETLGDGRTRRSSASVSNAGVDPRHQD